ncbi:MAG: MBL fold metallo-hydrolase [Deferrisomatales bacterium]|nr:MBL fold metallo-hydrolase [Deferrisomatales bacterium]
MELAPDLHGFFWRDPAANNCNTYLITGRVPLLIDPGHRAFFSQVETELRRVGLGSDTIGAVLITHGHPDHLEGAAGFAGRPARVGLHEIEAARLPEFDDAFYRARGAAPPEVTIDFFLQEGDLTIGDHTLQTLHTPGHSPGSVCLYWPEHKVLFTGDVLFNRGLGRTDLPGGNGEELKRSIRRLGALDVEWMLSGHGEPLQGNTAFQRNLELVERAYFNFI